MALNNNVFCVSNPAKILDGLWHIISESHIDLPNILIFVPSRRAVRSVEKFIASKMGGATILPKIVALGEAPEEYVDESLHTDVVPALERVVVLAYLLSGIKSIRNMSLALSIARMLVTMQDYLENSGVNINDVDWFGLVDEKYAQHFKDKAEILSILARAEHDIFNDKISETQSQNIGIRAWADYVRGLDENNSLVIVCGSTASVPVTRDLMSVIAKMQNGRIILPGKISGVYSDFIQDTNPYNSEYKFLSGIGLNQSDVQEIDVGDSHIDFMNRAFSNNVVQCDEYDLHNCHLIECASEAEEAASVAEIASCAVTENKTVLVITPDAAGNQRLQSEFSRHKICADFSGGTSGAASAAGRAILNLLDDWSETDNVSFDLLYAQNRYNLFDTVADIVEKYQDTMAPTFDIYDSESAQIWAQIKKLSDYLARYEIKLDVYGARAFIADALSGVRIRGVMNDSAPVVVLGTIESRMQTADVVILTGLNEGMFPGAGYENPWLPRKISNQIGLPAPGHKVSLMALDFMTLSCGPDVYWLRSKNSGGVDTQESRFLSRVIVARGSFDVAQNILDAVRARDVVEYRPLDYALPGEITDWSDVYVTELELLIHNPYAFYVRHILRLKPKDDYWVGVDARDFGTLVHNVLETADQSITESDLVDKMDAMAREKLGKNNLIFYFWHRRFVEIAPIAKQMLAQTPGAKTEIEGVIRIANRNVRARADRVWGDGVLDIKTGLAPSKSQLENGNMPQLPLEAMMLQNAGFAAYTSLQSDSPIMQFLQLKAGNTKIIEYDSEQTSVMMRAAYNRVTDLFNMYSVGGAEYKYLPTSDQKYRAFDDFARAQERD